MTEHSASLSWDVHIETPEPMPGGDLAPGENARFWSPTSATLISGEKSAPTAHTDSPQPETGG